MDTTMENKGKGKVVKGDEGTVKKNSRVSCSQVQEI